MEKPAKRTQKEVKPATEPRLGIFWLIGNRILSDSVPLSESEQYGDHRNYPHSHINVFQQWGRIGKVPPEFECYEEYPRGRVIYSAKTGFTLLADRCILKRKDVIAAIKKELHLPKKTSLGTDPHYRCFQCLHGTGEDD